MTFETFLEKTAFMNDVFRRLVEGRRMYARELALVKNPSFPCVCFQRVTGGQHIEHMDTVVQLPFRIWAWDEDGYSKAMTLYQAFYTALHRQQKSYQTAFGVMWETAYPVDFYDNETDRYAEIATWRANLFGL